MKTVIRALLCYVTLLFAQHINPGNGIYPQISCKNIGAGAINNTERRELHTKSTGTQPDYISDFKLIINNSAGTVFSVKAACSGTRTPSSGNLNCSTNSLSVTNNADGAVARTSGHVIGNLQQAVANCTNTYHYPVGTATGYIFSSFALCRAGNGCSVT